MKKLILAVLIAMTSGAAIAENEQIVFSTPNLAMPFEVHMQRTAVKAAKEMGVNLQVLDGQGSSPKQVADLENAITRGAQGFIVSPNDVNAVSSAVDEIQDAKLPVVTLDRSVDSQKKVPHFGANNYKGGQAIGDFVKTKFPDGADIILLTGQPGSSSNIERTKGIRDSLKAGGEKYKIVADQTSNWMRSEGMRIVESVLPSLPKRPQVILSANDDMALGAINALSNAGYNLAGGEGCTVIPVFSVDATEAAKELIANKQMTGSIKQDAEGMADAVATITANLIAGKDKFEGLNENYEVVDGWTVNIPYSVYTGE